MDENKTFNAPQEEEEGGIDIIALIRSLWDGRKTVIIVTAVFMVLGLVAALTMKRTYTVSSTMVPQMSSRSNSSLGSLAALAGVDLGMNTTTADLSPLIYPQIVSSVPFRKELLYTPLHYAKADTAVSMFTYQKEYVKPTAISYVLKYTIGLPGVIMGALRKPAPDLVMPGGAASDSIPRPILLTKDEEKYIKAIAQNVSLAVDKKEGYLTLTVTGSEPIQTAELAMKAQQLLQQEITRFRTEKAEDNLRYIQGRSRSLPERARTRSRPFAADDYQPLAHRTGAHPGPIQCIQLHLRRNGQAARTGEDAGQERHPHPHRHPAGHRSGQAVQQQGQNPCRLDLPRIRTGMRNRNRQGLPSETQRNAVRKKEGSIIQLDVSPFPQSEAVSGNGAASCFVSQSEFHGPVGYGVASVFHYEADGAHAVDAGKCVLAVEDDNIGGIGRVTGVVVGPESAFEA